MWDLWHKDIPYSYGYGMSYGNYLNVKRDCSYSASAPYHLLLSFLFYFNNAGTQAYLPA